MPISDTNVGTVKRPRNEHYMKTCTFSWICLSHWNCHFDDNVCAFKGKGHLPCSVFWVGEVKAWECKPERLWKSWDEDEKSSWVYLLLFWCVMFSAWDPLTTCSAADDDRHRAVAAVIRKPPSDWKWPLGRPNHTWLRAIEWDLRPVNIGPSCSRGRRQPLENTGVQLWTRLHSRRVYHEERDRENIFCTFYLFILMLRSRCKRSNAPSLLIVICDNLGASTKLFCQV